MDADLKILLTDQRKIYTKICSGLYNFKPTEKVDGVESIKGCSLLHTIKFSKLKTWDIKPLMGGQSYEYKQLIKTLYYNLDTVLECEMYSDLTEEENIRKVFKDFTRKIKKWHKNNTFPNGFKESEKKYLIKIFV